VKKLAGALNSMPSAPPSLPRSSRTRARFQKAVTRLITGVVATAALLFAAQALDRPQADSSVDTFHSISSLGPSAVLRSAPSHRLLLESRPPARTTNGFGAALPEFGQSTLASGVAGNAAAGASGVASPSIVGRGYDATAPPR
jgi:hypothetical protein